MAAIYAISNITFELHTVVEVKLRLILIFQRSPVRVMRFEVLPLREIKKADNHWTLCHIILVQVKISRSSTNKSIRYVK